MRRSLVSGTVCLGLIIGLLGAAATPGFTAPAAQEEFAADLVIAEADGKSMEMRVTVAEGKARMDMVSPDGEVSTIWTDGGMYMVMHDRKMYMHFSKEMMDRMGQMMGQMGAQATAEVEEFDPSRITFERTGNTETIGEYDSFEMKVTGESSAEMAFIWMSKDLEVGLFEVFSRMAEPLSSMNMPFMQSSSNPAAKLQEYQAYARAQGMPDGKVVRVVGSDGGTMTLGGLAWGSFDGIWGPPEGYTKQNMPGMPRQ